MSTAELTINKVESFKQENETLVADILIAQARMKAMRERINKEQAHVLAKYGYPDRKSFERDHEPDPKIYKDMDECNIKNKHDVREGYCPALIARAEYLNLREKAIIKMFELANVHSYNMDIREKTFQLFMTRTK